MDGILQLIRFSAVGAMAFFVHLGTTYILTEMAGIWYLWSYLIAITCSWTFIFLMNSFFTFPGHDTERRVKRYGLFVGVYAIAFIVNAGLVYLFTSVVGVYYVVSIISATAVSAAITFIFSKKYIFVYADHVSEDQ